MNVYGFDAHVVPMHVITRVGVVFWQATAAASS